MLCVNELCYIVIISIVSKLIFNLLVFIHFTNQITLKPSTKPGTKVKLLFKSSTIKGQINVPFWAHMGHKGWRKDRKTFIRCYAIVLKFWDEFNANFVLLHFSTCSSIKMRHLYLKNMEKSNKAVHLSLVLTYLF